VLFEYGQVWVHFLDVGQGDAIAFEMKGGFWGGKLALIDTGPDRSVLSSLNSALPFFNYFFNKNIDLLYITHNDADHAKGFTYLKDKYFAAIKFDFCEGQNIALWPRYTYKPIVFKVLHPDCSKKIHEENDDSTVAVANYYSMGTTKKVMLTGDVSKKVEKFLIKKFDAGILEADILKVGHHGSKTSTSKEFLQEVKPSVAIISSGKDNRYGHPHKDVLKTLLETLENIQILNTAERGTISIPLF
jgi:competence protein ComEC